MPNVAVMPSNAHERRAHERASRDPSRTPGWSEMEAQRSRARSVLAPQDINTEALISLIRQRLRQVESRAIHDILSDSAEGNGDALRDLFSALDALIVSLSDSHIRADVLLDTTLRVGLAYSIAFVAAQGALAHPGCDDINNLADAAYEGMARSAFAGALAFPQADGVVDPAACATFSTQVTDLFNAVGVLGISDLTTMAQLADVSAQAAAVMSSCSGAPIAEPLRAAASTALTHAPRLSLSQASALYAAFADLRGSELTARAISETPDAPGVRECAASAEAYAQLVEPLQAGGNVLASEGDLDTLAH